MQKLTPTQKKKMIAKMIELMVNLGYDIERFVSLPLSKYNFEAVELKIEKLTADLEYVNS